MSQNNTVHIIGVGINQSDISVVVPVCVYAVCDYADDYYI